MLEEYLKEQFNFLENYEDKWFKHCVIVWTTKFVPETVICERKKKSSSFVFTKKRVLKENGIDIKALLEIKTPIISNEYTLENFRTELGKLIDSIEFKGKANKMFKTLW